MEYLLIFKEGTQQYFQFREQGDSYEILGSHGGEHKDDSLLEYSAV
jgi:hypothetical protein